LFSLLLFLAASSLSGWGQASGLGLQAKAVATGGKVRTWSGGTATFYQASAYNHPVLTHDFWSTRARESQVGLEIDVRNFRRTPQHVEVLALFLAREIGSREIFLLSAEQAVFTLLNGEFTRTRMYSGLAQNNTARGYYRGTSPDPYGYYPFIWSGSWDASEGTKLYGWIVQAMVNGRVIETRASGPALEALAKDRQAMNQLMKPLAAAQVPREPE
jgi:hypothetical protein